MKTLRIDLSKELDEQSRMLQHPKGRSIALGYFDGVHRGHEELAHMVVQRAEVLGLEPTMFSFDRYPKPVPPHTILNAVVPGQESPTKYLLESPLPHVNYRFKGLIQTDRQRDRYFTKLGIELLILQEFNRNFADLEAEEFLNKVLRDKLQAKVIVVGEGYRFSKAQGGNVDMLRTWCDENGIELHVIPPVYAGKEIVSSSRIREAIENGEMGEVQKLLGDPFVIPGTVIHGNAIGRTIGMPTANFRMPSGMVVPKFGVYVSRTWVDGAYYDSITNVGLRPTVNHTDPQPLVETCILGRSIDLYDEYIEVELLHFMRGEERFPSFIAMSNQIAIDLEYARNWHMNQSRTYLYGIKNNIPLYVARSQRYNRAYLCMEFYMPLEKKESSENALLANVITSASREYPTRAALKSFLDSQYGSSIQVEFAAINNMQRISILLSSVHSGLDGSKPFENVYHILLDMLLNPLRNDEGGFIEEIVETEKKNLLMYINAQESDRKGKIFRRAEEIVFANKNYAKAYGDYNEVENITVHDLQEAWLRLISRSQIRVFMAGKMADTHVPDQVLLRIAQFPRMQKQKALIPGKFPEIMHFAEVQKVTEVQAVDSPHLLLLYAGLPAYTSMKCLNARVLHFILDGSDSLLSKALQEKLNSAYEVEAFYNSFQQTLTISLELEEEDMDEASAIIQEEIRAIANGDLSDTWYKSAMLAYHNRILSIGDDRQRSLRQNTYELLSGRKFIGESADCFAQSVKKEDILALANDLYVQLEYKVKPSKE